MWLSKPQSPTLRRFTLRVQRDGREFTVDVVADGDGVVSHAGAALVAETADRVGLTDQLSRVLTGLRARPGPHDPERVVIDVDATLITARTDKQGAAPTFKRGFGFHPLLAFLDDSREALAGMLRPGNAGANTAADHSTLLTLALEQLPGDVVCDAEI